LNFSILVSTAAPKILPVSLAPKDQPKKKTAEQVNKNHL